MINEKVKIDWEKDGTLTIWKKMFQRHGVVKGIVMTISVLTLSATYYIPWLRFDL